MFMMRIPRTAIPRRRSSDRIRSLDDTGEINTDSAVIDKEFLD